MLATLNGVLVVNDNTVLCIYENCFVLNDYQQRKIVLHRHKLALVICDVESILALSMLLVLYIFSVNRMLIASLLAALLHGSILILQL